MTNEIDHKCHGFAKTSCALEGKANLSCALSFISVGKGVFAVNRLIEALINVSTNGERKVPFGFLLPPPDRSTRLVSD